MATMMIGCDTTLDDSTDVVGSNADVLRAAVIDASTFAQLCLYVASDDLLLSVTIQLYARSMFEVLRPRVRSHSV
ncbi:hypothetical protein TNCV_840121 [Trichonephila clavipes]|nr:hypothetical protein TNCV_840121 [Trichonephila clavipes]